MLLVSLHGSKKHDASLILFITCNKDIIQIELLNSLQTFCKDGKIPYTQVLETYL